MAHDTSRENAKIAQSVEHVHGKDGVTGSIPVLGSRRLLFCGIRAFLKEIFLKNVIVSMGIIKENMAKLRCGECKKISTITKRNKKKVKEKLSLNKYCKFCRKHTQHAEVK